MTARDDAPGRLVNELAIVRGNHRGKVAALGVIVAVVFGLMWLRDQWRGIGRPEQDDHVLVVNTSGVQYKPALTSWGFQAQENRMPVLVEELGQVVPGATERGAAAALKLADWGGFAYVAFEDPASVDFSGVEIEGGVPTFAPHHRFAVVSAGDRGFPHVLTVSAPPSPARPGPEFDLLTALFAQEALAEAVRTEDVGPFAVLDLRKSVHGGILALEGIRAAEVAIEGIALRARTTLLEREKVEPRPRLLGTIDESASPTPLADGGLLLRVRKARFSDSLGGDLDIDASARFMYVPPGADPVTGRVPCDSLAGGTFDEFVFGAEVVATPEGDAILIAMGTQAQLYRLAGPGCHFELLGEVRIPSSAVDIGQPHRSGAVALVDRVLGEGFVYVRRPNDEAAYELVRTKARYSKPRWLAEDALAVIESPDKPGPRDSLLLIATTQPDRALRVDAAAFDGSSGISGIVAAPPGPSGPRLLVTTTGDHGLRLFRVDLPAPVPALVTAAVARVNMKRQPAEVRDGLQSLVVTVTDTKGWTFAALTGGLDVTGPTVSPDGRFVVFASDSELKGHHEIVAVPLAGGAPKFLTHNALDDRHPRFMADGRAIVFETTFKIERTAWTLTAARSLPAPE